MCNFLSHRSDCLQGEVFFSNPLVSSLELGWSGGAMALGKFQVPGRPTSLDDSSACNRCGWGLVVWTFFSHLSFLFSFSLSLGDGPI